MAESQAYSALDSQHYNDPSQLSQLLRQRSGNDEVTLFNISSESQLGTVASAATAQRSDSASVPQQILAATNHPKHFQGHLLPARRVGTTRHVKPALHAYHSAPISTAPAGVTVVAPKMHHSFNGMDTPGDTQPDSQIYKQWTSGIFGISETSNRLPSPKSLFTEHVDEDDPDRPTDSIELANSSQGRQSPTGTSPTVIHDDNGIFAPQEHNYALTSPLKFETPAVAGRKRDNSGQLLSSAMRTNTTPGTVASTSAFPGFGMGISAPMSLTQAWQNTQAPTSPAVAGMVEDAAFTRPSPNFAHVRHSSPIPALSSPSRGAQPEFARTDPLDRSSSEPRTEYISMKESQDRRKRTVTEKPPQLYQEDSWDMPSVAQLRMQKKKLREDLERKASMSFANISAPTTNAHSASKRVVVTKYRAPIKTKALDGADDSVDGFAEPSTVNAEDSPDELPQTSHAARAPVKHNIRDNKVQVPKTSSHPHGTQSGHSPRHSPPGSPPQLQPESHTPTTASQSLLRGALRPQSSKDSVAIMDSQPDATIGNESATHPKSLRFPSSPSTNQYSINQTTITTKTGYTSQVISSSIPPMPPGSSPHEVQSTQEDELVPEDEERVPSSPPLLTHEDDVSYDEHVYNEYEGGEAIRDSVEPLPADEDVAMKDEEDLPATKTELSDETATATKEPADDEIDLVEPQKIDTGTDQEVAETLEEEVDDAHTPRPSRLARQDTIPDTDAMEETQPSMFHDNGVVTHQTNSTEPFHTAQEQPPESESNTVVPASSKGDGSDTIQAGDRLRSLQDVYNLPETQQSAVEEEFEMPRLSGLGDEEEDGSISESSPVAPTAKRPKVTYSGKRKTFRSPTKKAIIEKNQSQHTPPPSNEVRQTSDPPQPTEQGIREAPSATHDSEGSQDSSARRATLKTKAVRKSAKPKTQKKGALKQVSKELLKSLSSPGNSPSKRQATVEVRPSPPTTPSRGKAISGDMHMADDDGRDELADRATEPVDNEVIRQSTADTGVVVTSDITVPNRVFASWPGSHYYPATCLGKTASKQLHVRYDDGNTTTLDAFLVRSLDLRQGDHVKVDEPGMKKHTYVVVGFKDRVDDLEGEQFPTTDCHGYATVVLEEKQRDSLAAGKKVKSPAQISVPTASIYLTTQLWTRLRDRSFNFSPPASPSKLTSHMTTPVPAGDLLPNPSFTRRGITIPSLLRDATARAASVASSARSGSGVFSNMAFVLTSTAADVDKDAIARTIKTNGGRILEDGFHELFDYESADAPTSSQSRRQSTTVSDEPVTLALKNQYKDLGFVALISDSHSRSTKYIQALALNVPCLHLRWIHDSLSTSSAVPFGRYLLPAGVSRFLDRHGVVRSRTMTLYDPSSEDVSFAQTISARDLLLHNQSVLLVAGKSKKEIEKRQPFIFLTHALGSAKVGRCADLSAAASMLAKEQWDWVYVDNGEQGVADAAGVLFGTGNGNGNTLPVASGRSKKAKKRKRDDTDEKEELVARGKVAGKAVKVTCSEFVIQSLILGELVE